MIRTITLIPKLLHSKRTVRELFIKIVELPSRLTLEHFPNNEKFEIRTLSKNDIIINPPNVAEQSWIWTAKDTRTRPIRLRLPGFPSFFWKVSLADIISGIFLLVFFVTDRIMLVTIIILGAVVSMRFWMLIPDDQLPGIRQHHRFCRFQWLMWPFEIAFYVRFR